MAAAAVGGIPSQPTPPSTGVQPSPAGNAPLPDRTTLCYQHAGDWVRLANSLTWTIASVYLVSAVLAMNGALQRAEEDYMRIVIAAVWIALLVMWLIIDNIYLGSARHARRIIERIEEDWPPPLQFYTSQKRDGIGGSGILTGLLYASAATLAAAWLVIVAPTVSHYYEKAGSRASQSSDLTLPK